MKWFAIAGKWDNVDEEVEKGVRETVHSIMQGGNGIVCGATLGVDCIATSEALLSDPTGTRIRVFLPSTLDLYASNYRKRAREGVVTPDEANLIVGQLVELYRRNPSAIIENPLTRIIDKSVYLSRISDIVGSADELIVFESGETEITSDAMTKASRKGIPIRKFTYGSSPHQ